MKAVPGGRNSRHCCHIPNTSPPFAAKNLRNCKLRKLKKRVARHLWSGNYCGLGQPLPIMKLIYKGSFLRPFVEGTFRADHGNRCVNHIHWPTIKTYLGFEAIISGCSSGGSRDYFMPEIDAIIWPQIRDLELKLSWFSALVTYIHRRVSLIISSKRNERRYSEFSS